MVGIYQLAHRPDSKWAKAKFERGQTSKKQQNDLKFKFQKI